ncbi:hypothetical protein FRC18_009247 [Serendipita sp. 400]|nr:hypothetical protein FRC18_009247 [Serendipita sp. 400]
MSSTSHSQPILPTINDPKTNVGASTSTTARAAKRTTKAAQKLQVLPDTPDPVTQSQLLNDARKHFGDEDLDTEPQPQESSPAEDEFEVYQQIAQIPEGTARADALKLTKKAIQMLPRVTAYCTARHGSHSDPSSSYNFEELLKFLKARKSTYETDARVLDDALYTPYSYKNAPQKPRRPGSTTRGSRSRPSSPAMGNLLNLGEDENTLEESRWSRSERFGKGRIRGLLSDTAEDLADIFIFKYGTVVIWNMSEEDEQRFLSSIKRFAEGNLCEYGSCLRVATLIATEAAAETQMEDLHYYYASYSRIFNDVITLRKGSSYMTKLALSHALAASATISLYEDRIAATISETKNIPDMIAESGSITMPHEDIMKHIGKVFLLRMNVNHVGSILDAPVRLCIRSPKFPDLRPLYDACREYLELPQRLEVLNSRVDVLQDMLKLLKETVVSRHSERLEQIVIALIAVEIILGLMTIAVDLFSPAYELP